MKQCHCHQRIRHKDYYLFNFKLMACHGVSVSNVMLCFQKLRFDSMILHTWLLLSASVLHILERFSLLHSLESRAGSPYPWLSTLCSVCLHWDLIQARQAGALAAILWTTLKVNWKWPTMLWRIYNMKIDLLAEINNLKAEKNVQFQDICH